MFVPGHPDRVSQSSRALLVIVGRTSFHPIRSMTWANESLKFEVWGENDGMMQIGRHTIGTGAHWRSTDAVAS